jgi:hypothetical protein
VPVHRRKRLRRGRRDCGAFHLVPRYASLLARLVALVVFGTQELVWHVVAVAVVRRAPSMIRSRCQACAVDDP